MPRTVSGFSSFFLGRRLGAAVLTVAIASQVVTPLVAAQSVEPLAPRPKFALPDSSIQSLILADDANDAWKKEVDAAKLRRSKGRRLEVGGFLLAVGGDIAANVMLQHSCNRYSGCSSSPAVVGLAFIAVGLPMGIVGKVRAHDADGEVNALIARGPRASGGLAIPAGANRSIDLTLGQTNAVSYRIKW